jgi:uncharacterized sporulation protein YeaH/YhbH (DUF444 family)
MSESPVNNMRETNGNGQKTRVGVGNSAGQRIHQVWSARACVADLIYIDLNIPNIDRKHARRVEGDR